MLIIARVFPGPVPPESPASSTRTGVEGTKSLLSYAFLWSDNWTQTSYYIIFPLYRKCKIFPCTCKKKEKKETTSAGGKLQLSAAFFKNLRQHYRTSVAKKRKSQESCEKNTEKLWKKKKNVIFFSKSSRACRVVHTCGKPWAYNFACFKTKTLFLVRMKE